MPFCPVCRSEFRRDITRCRSCDADLVEVLDEAPEVSPEEILAAMDAAELTSVARGTVDWCKEVQAKLLAAGVPAGIRHVRDRVAEAGHHLILEVLIRASDAETAARLFQGDLLQAVVEDGLVDADAIGSGSGDDDAGDAAPGDANEAPACPACGSTEALVDGECPECGLFLGDE